MATEQMYRVTAPVAVINTGTPGERYVYRHGVFTADPQAAFVAHLKDLRFIEEVNLENDVVVVASDATTGEQVAVSLQDMTLADLRELADGRGIKYAKTVTKTALIAQLEAANVTPEQSGAPVVPAVVTLEGMDASELLVEAERLGVQVPSDVTDADEIRALIVAQPAV